MFIKRETILTQVQYIVNKYNIIYYNVTRSFAVRSYKIYKYKNKYKSQYIMMTDIRNKNTIYGLKFILFRLQCNNIYNKTCIIYVYSYREKQQLCKGRYNQFLFIF